MRLRVCFLVCLLVAAFASGVTQAYGDERPELRAIHAVAGLGIVDVYFNETFAAQINFNQPGQFVSLPEGNITVRGFAAGETTNSEALFESEITARDGQVLNVVLMGTPDAVTVGAYATDRSPLELGMSRVNIINANPTLETLNVSLLDSANEIAATSALAFGETAQSEIAAGNYGLDYDVYMGLDTLVTFAGISYTVIVIGTENEFFEVNDIFVASATELDGAAGHVRFANTVDATSDVTINGVYIAMLEPNRGSSYLALPVGSYEVAITQSGVDTPMIETTIEIDETDWQTNIIVGTPDAAELIINDDDLSAPPAGEIRMQVINVSDDMVNMTVDGAIVLEGLAPDAASNVSMLTEAHDFELLTPEASLFSYADFWVLPASPFSIYTVIVSDTGTIMLSACAVE